MQRSLLVVMVIKLLKLINRSQSYCKKIKVAQLLEHMYKHITSIIPKQKRI